jgi:hypothetical protein
VIRRPRYPAPTEFSRVRRGRLVASRKSPVGENDRRIPCGSWGCGNAGCVPKGNGGWEDVTVACARGRKSRGCGCACTVKIFAEQPRSVCENYASRRKSYKEASRSASRRPLTEGTGYLVRQGSILYRTVRHWSRTQRCMGPRRSVIQWAETIRRDCRMDHPAELETLLGL